MGFKHFTPEARKLVVEWGGPNDLDELHRAALAQSYEVSEDDTITADDLRIALQEVV